MNKTGRKQPAWRTLFPPLLVANSPFSPSSDLRVFALILLDKNTLSPNHCMICTVISIMSLPKTANTQPTSSHTLSCFISPELFSPSGVQYIYLLSTPFHWNVKSTWKWIFVSLVQRSIPASTTVPGTQVVFNKYFN